MEIPRRQRYGTVIMVSSRVVLAAVALALVPSCKKKDEPVPVQKAEAAPEPPVPAPDGLAVEAIVRAPDAIAQSFRTISPIVPDRVAPLLADMLHVSRETTDEVDGTKPAYFVMVRRNGETGFVFALQLKDPGKVLASLGKQGLARTEDPTHALSIFEAGQASSGPRGQVLGVRRSYLLAASTVASLKELAPYATRTMPTRALPKEDIALTVPKSAMRGPVRDALFAAVQAAALRRKMVVGGDAGAPRGVSAMDAVAAYAARSNEKVVGWLADAGDAHVTITTQSGALALHADVEVDNPESPFGKQIAAWPVGDAAPALSVPVNALLSFVGRSSEAVRAESSRELVEMLATSYPDDVGVKERAKLEEFLAAWDKARGDVTSGALLYEGPARVAVGMRLQAKDPAALAKLTREAMTAVLALKGVSQGLVREGIGVPKFSEATLAGTHVDVLSLKMPHAPGETPKPGEPETADVVFGVVPGTSELAIVSGVGSKELFATFVEGKSEKSLASIPTVKQKIESLGAGFAGLVMGFPGRMMPLANGAPVSVVAPANDPVILSMGRGPKGPFVTVDVARPAVELAGRFAVSAMLKK